MAVGVEQFWQLAIEGGLYSAADVRRLATAFQAAAIAANGNGAVRELVRWLLGKRVLTRYQAELLLAGQPGPFRYGEYKILDYRRDGPFAGLFAAVHCESRHRVLLRFLSEEELAGNSAAIEDATRRMAQLTRAAPALWRVYESVAQDGYQFVVIDDTPGATLAHRLANGPPLDRRTALRVALRTTEALAVLHRCRLGHGAVDSDAVWIDSSGEAKLIGYPVAIPPDRSTDTDAPGVADADGLAGIIEAVLLSDSSEDELSVGGPPLCTTALSDLRSAIAQLQSTQSVDVELQHLAEHLRTLFDDPDDSASVARRTAAAVAFESTLNSAVEERTQRPVAPAVVATAATGVPILRDSQEGLSTNSRRRAKSRSRAASIVVATVAVATVVGIAFWLGLDRRKDNGSSALTSDQNADRKPQPTLSTNNNVSPATEDEPSRQPHQPTRAVAGQLWDSPTAGGPIDLAYLPAGVQAIVAVRPASLLEAAGGPLLDERVSGVFSDWLGQSLSAKVGVEPDQIEQVIVAFVDSASTDPVYATVVRTTAPQHAASLEAAWGKPKPDNDAGGVMYARGVDVCWLPPSTGERLMVIGPEALIRDNIVPMAGDSPPLRRELEDLWPSTDAARHVTAVFAPRFFQSGGRSLLPGPAENLRHACEWLLAGWEAEAAGTTPLSMDGSALPPAALASAHLDEDLYLELRVAADPRRPVATQAEALRRRWGEAPRRVARAIISASVTPYSADVLSQFPRMVEVVEAHTLAGIDGRQLVLAAYAPARAAHNLVLGTRLGLLELSAGGEGQSAQTVASTAEPRTAAERLRRPTSLVFDKAPLDRAIEMLAEDLGISIVILGQDLEKEGITKNQSINRLEERDRPAVDILRKIMIQANPDGKLVYVVRPAGDGSGEVVAITTRSAVAERGEKLPEELAAP